MRYLLDTHALLWAVDSPEKLSATVSVIVHDAANQLLVSIATPWELAIKANPGRLEKRLDVDELLNHFERTISSAGYVILETTIAHAVRAGRLPLHHRDPFDRLLIAQSLDLRVPIISRDGIFDRYGVKRIWK
ncbi:MAG: type II toxin-antitoxin system VapC family toxin [Terracidiphilus sp.]|jgi:PIN domain nuclease of toxin-antitoxin system